MNFKEFITGLKNGFVYLRKLHSIPVAFLWIVQIFLFFIGVRLIYYLYYQKKKKGKVAIAFSSVHYTGNPRAVYERIMEKYSDKYDCYWVAKRWETIRHVKEKGGMVFYSYSLLGILWFLKTDVWIRSHPGLDVFSFLPNKNYELIQLWHGVGPKGSVFSKEDFEMHDAWCFASTYVKQRYIKLWNPPLEKLYVTGFAEMDMLYNYLETPKEKLLQEIGIENNRKIILYAPTYDVGLWPWGDVYVEFEKLCRFCNETKLVLILRLHPYAKIKKAKLKRIIKEYGNVYWLDMPKEPDTMKLLAIADILVTDWSSIYTDYFLTKRPIIYLEVNKEYFTKIRGAGDIPPEYRAGEIVHNNEEFYEALKTVLKEGNRFEKEQEKLLKIIHGKVDGKASERVLNVIEGLLGLTRYNI